MERHEWQNAFIAILDVGHGNCAIVRHGEEAAAVDVGHGPWALEFLRELGLAALQTVIISHSDQDHVGALLLMVTQGEPQICEVRLNPDAKKGQVWDDLSAALADANARGDVTFRLSVVSGDSFALGEDGDVRIEVFAPSKSMAMKGPGGRHEGTRISSNTMSVVVRVLCDGVPRALFTADLDEPGLVALRKGGHDIEAPVLVYPHHGGLTGSDSSQFAADLCSIVRPQIVVFSNGRGKHGCPRPEVVSAVRTVQPDVRILCTELAQNCCQGDCPIQAGHLMCESSRGRAINHCCAGTIIIPMAGPDIIVLPDEVAHKSFISAAAASALCED